MRQQTEVRNGPARLRTALWEAFRESVSDWVNMIGIPLNVLALFAFTVGVLTLPLSSVLAGVLDLYRSVTSVFDVIEYLLLIEIPNLRRDVLLFWTISGAIGARTTIRLQRKIKEIAERSLQRSTDPDIQAGLVKLRGSEWVERELAFTEGVLRLATETIEKRRVLYIGCIITGPLFFLRILWVNPSLPFYTPLTGRLMVAVDVLALAAGFSLLFSLNWATL